MLFTVRTGLILITSNCTLNEKAEQMAKTIPLEKLGAEIEHILTEYSKEVTTELQDATELVTKAGARAVSQNARAQFGGSGKYARGWRGQTERDRLSAEGVIYNATTPGLPHLLEHGHAKRGGGRVPGRSHIKPVEDKIIKDFERKVRGIIT